MAKAKKAKKARKKSPTEVAKAKMAPKKRRGKVKVEKGNVVLDELNIVYMGVNDVKPNSYNPNRQSDHDFTLLCKSIDDDGFTQPIIVHEETHEIVDGEHRWRACKALGFSEVPCVMVSMSAEQMRISTLRHNRARGSEDVGLAADVLRDLVGSGATDWAKEGLMLDDVEMNRLVKDMPEDEVALMNIDVPDSMLGATGTGVSAFDREHGIDTTADARRAKEKILAEAKAAEERTMAQADDSKFRLVLFFTGKEAETVRAVLGKEAANRLLAICKEEAAAA